MRIFLVISFSLCLQLASAQQLIPYQVYKSGEENTEQRWGYKNEKHQIVISPINEIPAFYNGDFVLVKKAKSYGIMDKKGKIVVPLSYRQIFPGKAYWTLNNENGQSFFSTRTKEIVTVEDAVATSYDKVFIKEKAAVKSGSIGYIPASYQLINDKAGVLSQEYSNIHDFGDGVIHFTNEEKNEGLMDSTGKIILPPAYNSIGIFNHGQAVIRDNGKDGVIDSRGNVIAPPAYQLIDSKNTMYHVKDSSGVYVTDFKNITIGKNLGMTSVAYGPKDFAVMSRRAEVFLVNRNNTIQNKEGYASIVSFDGKNYLFVDKHKVYIIEDGRKKQLPYDSVKGAFNSNSDYIVVYGSAKGAKYSVLLDNKFKELLNPGSELVGIDYELGLAYTYFSVNSTVMQRGKKFNISTTYKLSYIDAKGKRFSEVLK